jgi:hypothetical protein
MQGPEDTHMRRGMLLFAVVLLVLAVWMSLDGAWGDAVLWYAAAVLVACYGGLLGGVHERWHRPLLVIGLLAGVVAFGAALHATGLVRW